MGTKSALIERAVEHKMFDTAEGLWQLHQKALVCFDHAGLLCGVHG